MKKLIVLSFLVFFTTFVFGQRAAKFTWFDAGIKAQYGGAMIWNSGVSDGDTHRYDIGSSFSYGGKIGLNKGSHGFTVDVMFGSAKQNFENAEDMANNLNVKWDYLDIYPLYRNNAQLGYVEIGPKFSIIQGVENTIASEGTAVDVTSNYEGTNIGAVLGFGAYFIGSDNRFSGILGLRLEYGITDMVNGNGHTAGFPVLEPSIHDPAVIASHPIFAGIVFEANWGIGYYGKASCGGRSKFIKF